MNAWTEVKDCPHEWVSVRDKKPDEGGCVLVILQNRTMHVLDYEKTEKDERNNLFHAQIPYDPAWVTYNRVSPVTHWMLLPEPPHD